MMSNLTNEFEDAVIQFFLRNDADTFSVDATLYQHLFTAAPGEAGGGTEVADANGYVPKAIAFTDPSGTGTTESTAQIDHVASGGSWGTVSHMTVDRSSTYGSTFMYLYGALTTPRAIGDGETLRFAAGDVDFVLD
jgi:hypothetical protein